MEAVPSELPAGWRRVALGDITRVVGGTTPKSSTPEYWGGDIVWVTPTDLGKLADKEVSTCERKITKAGYDSCGLNLVPADSVILSTRAPIGHLGIAQVDLCTNQGCRSLVPSSAVDSIYLYFALKWSVDDLKNLGSGSTFAELSKSNLQSFEIPLPPIQAQKRIAAILNEQMAAVEQARKASEACLEAVRALPAAYLREAFSGGGGTLPERRRWIALGDVCEVKRGTTITRKEVVEGDVPVIAGGQRPAYFHNQPNCVGPVITVSGSGAYAGFVNFFDTPIFASDCSTIQAISKEVEIQFAYLFLKSKQEAIYALQQGSGQPHVYPKDIAKIEIPLPSLSEQKRIAVILAEQMAAVEQLQKSIMEEASAIAALPASLLRQAFSGAI